MGKGDEAQYITEEFLAELEVEMMAAAEALEFERAAALRDRIQKMQSQMGKSVAEAEVEHATRNRRGRKKSQAPSGRIPRPNRGV